MIMTLSERQARFCVPRSRNNLSSFYSFRPFHLILPTFLVLIAAVSAVGQSTGPSGEAAANTALTRIERARALAAVHQLQPAATELENVRAASKDVALRNVAT